MLAADFIAGSAFVKLDADVVFEAEILRRLLGSEKIGASTATLLIAELQAMMEDVDNLPEYYEGAYERLIAKDVAFHAVDITGLKWTEIDTRHDFDAAEKIFGGSTEPGQKTRPKF